MAVLAVIGGIDGRLRLGGQVMHDEFGEGTVTRITPKGRITVQFCDMRMCRVCPLNQLKPVCSLAELSSVGVVLKLVCNVRTCTLCCLLGSYLCESGVHVAFLLR